MLRPLNLVLGPVEEDLSNFSVEHMRERIVDRKNFIPTSVGKGAIDHITDSAHNTTLQGAIEAIAKIYRLRTGDTTQ